MYSSKSNSVVFENNQKVCRERYDILLVFNQIRFQPNDHKTIKETADELKIFEGIKHPNLVRYFGVELHRVRPHTFNNHVVHTEAVWY